MSKALKIILSSLITLILAFVFFLIWSTIYDYQPANKELIFKSTPETIAADTFKAVTWNIGYSGLGDDMDFFYDGGQKMRTSKNRVQENIQANIATLEKFRNFDFFLLQEVDIDSKRSYYTNQKQLIEKTYSNHVWCFALNYNVNFVPLPIKNPLGKVKSGLLIGSKYKPTNTYRYSFKGNYSWPTSIFMLDRCFLVNAYPIENGDTLFIVNTHNTAYDNGGLRNKQMQQLKKWLLKKHQKGNYILVGGDWNQIPTSIGINQFGKFPSSKKYTPQKIPSNYLPKEWKFIYDTLTPTNRGLDTLYNANSYKTIIDFFLISPNIKSLKVKTLDLNFKNSDHQPVMIEFYIQKIND